MQGFWNLIGKGGEGPGKYFDYDIGEKVSSSFDSKSIWTLHHGKKKVNGDLVTVFICNAKVSSPDEFLLAKTAHKRLKTLRHPNIIKYLDGIESENLVYMVTEAVVPLCTFLDGEDGRNPNLVNWGLYQVITGLSFLVNDVKLIHENVNIFSIFVGLDGEWKLGGVEYMHSVETTPVGKLPCLCRYDPPEGNCSAKREIWSADAWGLGCLIWEIHNGALQKTSDLKLINKIPKLLLVHYCDLVQANMKKRTNPKEFLQRCMEPGQFFDNDFVKTILFLSEIQIKDFDEQKEFFIALNKSLDSFPKQFCIHKVLPQLLNAFEYGSAGSSVLSPLFKVGLLLDDAAYQAKIVPCIIKLFSSNDRATRIQLLQQMEKFVLHLQPSVVDNQIFACVATGFGDTLPAMREQTIKAMLLLAPKLSAKTINNQLLRYFAKLQMDEQPGIRTNTTICLGKVAEYIPAETRQKVLVPAFTRAIHDPFPHARTAGIMAISATHKYYSSNDIAVKLLPALCVAAIDPEKTVRDNAFAVIKAFISTLEKKSCEINSNASGSSTDLSKPNAESGATWAGWAVSSFTSRFYQNSPNSLEQKNISIPEKEDPGKKSEISGEKKVTENIVKGGVDKISEHSNPNTYPLDNNCWDNSKAGSKVEKCDRDSDSDYGDWGTGEDDAWSNENDKWESLEDSQRKPMENKINAYTEKPFSTISSQQTIPSPVQVKSPQLTSDNINWGDDDKEWDADRWDDNIGLTAKENNDEEEKEKLKLEQQKKRKEKNIQRELATMNDREYNADAWNDDIAFDEENGKELKNERQKQEIHMRVEERKSHQELGNNENNGWGDDGWGDSIGWDDELKKKEEEKERRKEELRRKREEKKMQRDLANKEKKAKSTGAMKLGAVKKNPKGDG